MNLHFVYVRNIRFICDGEIYLRTYLPVLQEVDNEDLPRGANLSKEARLNISALNFWTTGQPAFFDVRVFNLFTWRYSKIAVKKCFRANEN